MQKGKFKSYLFLHNISKKNNFGTILRSAAAFGIQTVFYVAKNPLKEKQRVLDSFNFFGNKGTLKLMNFHSFHSVVQAKTYFKDNGLLVCGVEIDQKAQPIHKCQFRGPTVFFLGNQGTGLLPVHKEICDHFVYIPQYTDKTGSLNVSVAAGIIFHHFALWAGFQEAKRHGQKFKEVEQHKIEEDD